MSQTIQETTMQEALRRIPEYVSTQVAKATPTGLASFRLAPDGRADPLVIPIPCQDPGDTLRELPLWRKVNPFLSTLDLSDSPELDERLPDVLRQAAKLIREQTTLLKDGWRLLLVHNTYQEVPEALGTFGYRYLQLERSRLEPLTEDQLAAVALAKQRIREMIAGRESFSICDVVSEYLSTFTDPEHLKQLPRDPCDREQPNLKHYIDEVAEELGFGPGGHP